MDKIQPLFTATATSVGGRNGHTESSGHIVSADLSVPKAMGGPGKPGTATPEHLFAAGYAACFGGALDFVGKQHKQDAARPRSPARCRSARVRAAASASRSSCASRTRA
jgi:organic hydroperoxide reductase OsmC/OhrA